MIKDSLDLNECSRRFKIPKPTLKRHLMKRNKHANETCITKALLFIRKYGIILLQLPGRTTHRLQPLDIIFF